MKDKSGLVMALLVLLGILCLFALIVGITKQVDKERSASRQMNEISWSSVEIESWHDMDSNKVMSVVLGFRRDGTVVWKEVHMNKLQKYSLLMFDDKDGKQKGELKQENEL